MTPHMGTTMATIDSGGSQRPNNFLPPKPLCESAITIYAPHSYPGPGASGSGGSSYQIEVSG